MEEKMQTPGFHLVSDQRLQGRDIMSHYVTLISFFTQNNVL